MRKRSLVVILLSLTRLLVGADWYVAPSGVDINPGTQGSPFRQIRAGVAAAAPGDTIHVADGSYLGFDVVGIAGTGAAPLTIQAQGSNARVTVTTDRADNRDTIFVSYCSYVVIDGLQALSANRAGCRVDNSQHVTVENCIFGNCATWGLFTDFSDNLLIEGNECYGSVQQHGCYVSNTCNAPVVSHNRFHDNAACGLHMNGDVSQGGSGIITNALVEFNTIYNNGSPNGGSGINCDGVVNGTFLGNLVYNEHASGMSLYQIDASGPSTGAVIIGNTFDVASDGRWALNIANGSTGAIVFDNVLLNHNGSHGSVQFDAASCAVGFQCDYNVLCTGSIVGTEDGNNTQLGLTAWRALGFDAHSITATQSALFASWSAGAYTLAASSPAIGAGASSFASRSPPTLDLAGNPRPGPSGYSIGAYEVPGGANGGSGTATGGSGTANGGSGTTGTMPPGNTGGGGGGGCGLGAGLGLLMIPLLMAACRRSPGRPC